MPASSLLPQELLRYLPDSELSVANWRVGESVLELNLKKEIGLEQGVIKLSGVSRVCLPPWLQISGLECTTESRFLADPIEPEEFLFIIHGTSWELPFYVVATKLVYVVVAYAG